MRQLKQPPGGNVLIYGSGQLMEYLRQHKLLDEYRLLVFPVVLSSGKQLFTPEGRPTDFKLVAAITSVGVQLLTYRPA